jgi:hypothetical protein
VIALAVAFTAPTAVDAGLAFLVVVVTGFFLIGHALPAHYRGRLCFFDVRELDARRGWIPNVRGSNDAFPSRECTGNENGLNRA